MAAIGQFNPNAQAPLESYISIPKGEWNAKIIDSKVEGTDASNSKVVLTFEVDEGSAKGGKADVHLFLWSPEKKGEISRRKLTSIANAVGIFQEFGDTSVLHGRPLTLTTDVRFVAKTDGTGFMDFPDVKAFKTYVGGGRAAGADPVQPQAPGAAAPASNAPSLPAAPSFGGGMPQAPSFAPPAAPAAPSFPGTPMGGYAPPAQAGAFAPPMAPAQQFPGAPGSFAPPMGQTPAPFAPPVPGAPAPFATPPR